MIKANILYHIEYGMVMSQEDLGNTLVKDVMTRALISVDPATTLFQIAKMMEQGGTGSIIVKKDGNPAGIITDRDFAIKVAVGNHPMNTPVENVATYPLITIDSNDSILDAALTMSSRKIRKLAVTEDGKVIGIITSTDLVNQLAKSKA